MKLLNRFCQIFWFILCLIHITTIFDSYYSYQTISNTIFKYPDPFDPFGLELCFKYAEVINVSAINREYPLQQLSKLSERYQESIQEIATGEDILNFTPKIEELIKSCKIRNGDPYLTNYNQSQCFAHFKIEKYFIGTFVCYDITGEDATKTSYYENNT